MDWSTVVVSALLSAVVSGAVSLLAVPQTAVRQRRAERREEARESLEAILGPMVQQVALYRAGLNKGVRRESDEDRMHGDDYVLVSEILLAAQHLSSLRFWSITRRCRRVFGPFLADLARLQPATEASWGNILAPLLAGYDPDTKWGRMTAEQRFGTLHRALQCDPDSGEIKRLDRDLRWLAAGW